MMKSFYNKNYISLSRTLTTSNYPNLPSMVEIAGDCDGRWVQGAKAVGRIRNFHRCAAQ